MSGCDSATPTSSTPCTRSAVGPALPRRGARRTARQVDGRGRRLQRPGRGAGPGRRGGRLRPGQLAGGGQLQPLDPRRPGAPRCREGSSGSTARPRRTTEFWREASPRTYFDRLTEPLLIHHGTVDESSPIRWSRQSPAALERAGADARDARLPGRAARLRRRVAVVDAADRPVLRPPPRLSAAARRCLILVGDLCASSTLRAFGAEVHHEPPSVTSACSLFLPPPPCSSSPRRCRPTQGGAIACELGEVGHPSALGSRSVAVDVRRGRGAERPASTT